MTVARDFIGREIKAGDTIVYPVRRGSSMWLNRLEVQQVSQGPKGPQVAGTNSKGRRITISNIDNAVVVQPLPAPEPSV
jgi:hypothetical protein